MSLDFKPAKGYTTDENIIYYWLKYEDVITANIEYDIVHNLFSMEAIRPDLFFDRLDKLFFTDKKFREFVEKRITPRYQGGFNEIVEKLDLDLNDPELSWHMFVKTRGANVKDKTWLALREDESREEGDPWYRIEHPEIYGDVLGEVE